MQTDTNSIVAVLLCVAQFLWTQRLLSSNFSAIINVNMKSLFGVDVQTAFEVSNVSFCVV